MGKPRTFGAWIAALALLPAYAGAQQAPAQTMKSGVFNIQYGAGGITSLRRAEDQYDTEYLSPGGVLGRVVVRYKTPDGAWQETRDVGLTSKSGADANVATYALGQPLPTLAQESQASASVGGTFIESINDDQAPASLGAGRGRGGRGAGAAAAGAAGRAAGARGAAGTSATLAGRGRRGARGNAGTTGTLAGRAGRGARGGAAGTTGTLAAGRAGAAAGGRGAAGRGGFGAPEIPAFTWAGQKASTSWVQYTFPKAQQVSSIQVYWDNNPDAASPVKLPASWRLLYQDGSDWKEASSTGGYGTQADQFNIVNFAPVTTGALRVEAKLPADATSGIYEWRVGSGEHAISPPKDVTVNENFKLDGDVLDWKVTVSNQNSQSLELGDVAIPLSMAEGTPAGRGQIYTQKLIRHSYISGNGSWIYWQRANAEGPFLVMTMNDASKFEYSGALSALPNAAAAGGPAAGAGRGRGGRGAAGAGGGGGRGGGFTTFVNAEISSAGPIAEAQQQWGRKEAWPLPISNQKLAPKGSPGDSITYGFRFQWAKDFDGVRDVLYKENEFDVNIAPGMAIPTDLPAMVDLHTKNKIDEVVAQYPGDTKIESLGDKGNDNKVYKVTFNKLGENELTVKYSGGKWMALQFFVTEPLETVIDKRASFLVTHMQHTDPSQWWIGEYADWDQLNKIRRSPIDRDGLSPWLTDSSDDAGNARPAYVASKNAFFPNAKEIASVELYISRYLWNGARWDSGTGGMQMTEKEPYPYGIYGTFANWYEHRHAADEPTNPNTTLQAWVRDHKEHLWRIYDYPHIMLMYYRMYQIAKYNPTLVHWATADEYLMLAYHTSVAYWTVPMQTDKPRGWNANSVPTMNEAFVPELIDALEKEGKKTEAAKLRELWDTKVEHYVNTRTRPNLFGSEFAFDSTGFESTGSMAHYAVVHAGQPGPEGSSLYTPDQAKEFLEFQQRLNTGDRGWLETTYFQLGSDYRGGLNYLLSYMSQMGGWAILDHGLYFAKDPTEDLRLGYASTLSSWALVNSGTAESGYGYWWPGKENDGATGGGFNPEVIGNGWIRKAVPRGAWYYSAEEDVGYCGALRAHATVLTKDPAFGDYAYGGLTTRDGDSLSIIPRDGLRVRFHVVRGDQRLHMELTHDGYAKEQPIVVNDSLSKIQFAVENRSTGAHTTQLELAGMPQGTYNVTVDGKAVKTINTLGDAATQTIDIPVGDGGPAKVLIQKAS